MTKETWNLMDKIFKLQVDDHHSGSHRKSHWSLMIPDSLLPQWQNVNPSRLTSSLQDARVGFHKEVACDCAKEELKA